MRGVNVRPAHCEKLSRSSSTAQSAQPRDRSSAAITSANHRALLSYGRAQRKRILSTASSQGDRHDDHRLSNRGRGRGDDPATPLPWFDLNDYPTKAFEREWQGTTNFDVIVNPQGGLVDCKIAKSSGHEMLDRQACWVAMKRARFTPAIGTDGQRAYGVYRSQVVWARPDRSGMQRNLGPDLEVSVNQLPPGATGSAAVKLAYFVDATGNPSACTPCPTAQSNRRS